MKKLGIESSIRKLTLENRLMKNKIKNLSESLITEEVNGFFCYDAEDSIFCVDVANEIYIFTKKGLGIEGSNINYDEIDTLIENVFMTVEELEEVLIPLESVDRFKDEITSSDVENIMYTFVNDDTILIDENYDYFRINDGGDNDSKLSVIKDFKGSGSKSR